MGEGVFDGEACAAMPNATDHIHIRGRTIQLDKIMSTELEDADAVAMRAMSFQSATPFEHCVIDNLFDHDLLSLINDEFDLANEWRRNNNSYESTYRSPLAARLGPATKTYFQCASDQAFVTYLERISGISGLIPDPMLAGGGLHETRAGGLFKVHRDFNLNSHNSLTNTLVMITYLNEDWSDDYGGALELWDKDGCVAKVQPEFGRTVIFRHSDRSFHGHPTPLTPPPGRTRRSITCYYYTNPLHDELASFRHSTQYLSSDGRVRGRLHLIVKDWTPPALARLFVRLRARLFPSSRWGR